MKVSTFFLPLPDPALLPDGSPPPGGWPDPPDNSLRDLWDAAEIYAPNLNARNQMAVVASKIPPPAYLWMFLMKTRGSPWSRVQHEIAEIWLGGYSEFTIALLGGLKRIYVEPFTPKPAIITRDEAWRRCCQRTVAVLGVFGDPDYRR